MTNETTPKTGIRRLWPDKWYWRVIILVVLLYVLAAMAIPLLMSESDAAVKPLTRASQVNNHLSPQVIKATFANMRVHPNPAVAAAFLRIAEEQDVVGATFRVRPRFTAKCPAGAPKGCPTDRGRYRAVGCENKIWRTKYIHIKSNLLHWTFNVAWRRTAIDSWCWDRKRIRNWGMNSGDDGKDAIFPYCWYNETHGKEWVSNFWQQKVYNQGSLKVCGKASPQKTVKPQLYYKRGGLYNTGS